MSDTGEEIYYKHWTSHNCESWLNSVKLLPSSDAQAEVSCAGSQEGKMDVKWGKQGQTRTHENELVHTSASNLNNAGDIGAFYRGVACVPWPRFSAAGRRDLTQVEEAAGMVLLSANKASQQSMSYNSAW